MRKLVESDIFSEYLDRGNGITGKIAKILSGMDKEGIILNNALSVPLSTITRHYKDPSTIRIVDAVKDGRIILYKTGPDFALPYCLPFIKFKQNGVSKVLVNLTKYLIEEYDDNKTVVGYDIEATKLYALLLPAYLTLELFDDNTVLSSETLYCASILWSKMFNKVLVRSIGLATNRDRYNAFLYFGMIFFLKYYCNTPDVIIEGILDKYFGKNKESQFILFMKEQIKRLGVEESMYTSFKNFCTTLFNNEISNIRGAKVSNISDSINTQFYVSQFINMYKFESLLALATFPYFLFVLISVDLHAGICADKSIDDILKDEKKLMPRLLVSLYREIR